MFGVQRGRDGMSFWQQVFWAQFTFPLYQKRMSTVQLLRSFNLLSNGHRVNMISWSFPSMKSICFINIQWEGLMLLGCHLIPSCQHVCIRQVINFIPASAVVVRLCRFLESKKKACLEHLFPFVALFVIAMPTSWLPDTCIRLRCLRWMVATHRPILVMICALH